ncbi:Eukaryotic translation initiation factor 2 subunit beta [Chlorella vulgaris]
MSAEEAAAATAEVEKLTVDDDDLALDFGKKKKKKSSKVKEDGEAAADGGEAGDAAAAPAAEDEDELSLDLALGKKKKKKKAKAREVDEFGGLDGEGGGEGEGQRSSGGLPWEGSDRDYTYEELLDRVFNILKAHNPELTGERRRTTLKPPQVAREGTKKTVFTNFMELCKSMNRNHEHVLQFLLSELGTSGSLDGTQRLIVKGRFLPKAFETVLRRYINDYVLCNSCKSVDTLLDRDSATRIMFLRCQQCSASRTVSAIKTGYQARTVSRKSQQTG